MGLLVAILIALSPVFVWIWHTTDQNRIDIEVLKEVLTDDDSAT